MLTVVCTPLALHCQASCLVLPATHSVISYFFIGSFCHKCPGPTFHSVPPPHSFVPTLIQLPETKFAIPTSSQPRPGASSSRTHVQLVHGHGRSAYVSVQCLLSLLARSLPTITPSYSLLCMSASFQEQEEHGKVQ